MQNTIKNNMTQKLFFDSLGRIIKLRVKVFAEVTKHFLEKRNWVLYENNSSREHAEIVITLFDNVNKLHQHDDDLLDNENSSLGIEDAMCLEHAKVNIINYIHEGHLHVPVYSHTRPANGNKFIMHVLLSMRSFITEKELIMHPKMRDCFRTSSLTVKNNNIDSLQACSDALLCRHIYLMS